MKIVFITACILAAALTWMPTVQAQNAAVDVPALIERVAAAYGGREALSAARSFRQSGATVSYQRGSETGRITRIFQAPDRLRVEIVYPGEAPEVRLLDGERGWNQGREAPPALLDAMRLQAARLDLPMLLLDAGLRVKDLGYVPAGNGRIIRTLGLALADHLSLFVEIEVPGYRILRSRGQMRRAGRSMEFGADYSDFRNWAGVLVPAREDQYAMGQPIGHTVIEEFEALAAPDPAAFRP